MGMPIVSGLLLVQIVTMLLYHAKSEDNNRKFIRSIKYKGDISLNK
jgi:hypothetical protein